MSVIINTNSAATVAANNLASSSSMLQRSLNRLSSGSKIVSPSDDAGGLAVSMKLSSAAHRQGATAANLGNTISFLQTQDGVLQVTSKVLSRIGELKTLANDPTKNSTDIANYNAEFKQLQSQLTSLGGEKFNGIDLFGANSLTAKTTEDGSSSITINGVNLLSTPGTPTNFSFTDGVVNGPDSTNFTPPSAGTLTTTSGGVFFKNLAGTGGVHMDQVGSTATYDGAGGWTFSGPGITTVGASLASGTSTIVLDGSMNTAYLGAGTFTPAASNTNTGNVSAASNLTSLSMSTITSAIQDVAGYRATNGAQQSRLQFSTEILNVNKANLEAANSRISDVDVAEESTQLARYNILVQAGTSMLTQANQSAQVALKLLG